MSAIFKVFRYPHSWFFRFKENFVYILNDSDFRIQETNNEGESTDCPSDCPEEKLFESFFEDIKHLVVNFEENRGTENAETYLKILLNRVHVSSFHSYILTKTLARNL